MPIHKLYCKYKVPTGFTVVELLVATAIFIIVVTAVIQLLFMFLRGPLQQIRQKQLEEQLTYATNEISHYIRQSTIDYSSVTGFPSTTLGVITTNTTAITFSYDSTGKTLTFTQAGAPVVNLTGANVKVTNVQFYVYPASDPTITSPGAAAVNNQPAVVIVIQAERKDDPSIKAQFQVLTTSRYYGR